MQTDLDDSTEEAPYPAAETDRDSTPKATPAARTDDAAVPIPQTKTQTSSRAAAPAPATGGRTGGASGGRDGNVLDTLAAHYAAMQPAPAAQPRTRVAGKDATQTGRQPSIDVGRQTATGTIGRGLAASDARRAARPAAPRHFTEGPTGFTDFARTYGTNASAAQSAADRLLGGVRENARDAYGALEDRYGNFADEVARGTRGMTRTGEYSGPEGFEYGDLADQFSGVQDELGALQDGAGGVQALDPRASRFSAGLISSAAQPQVDRLEREYGGIGDALSGAVAEGDRLIDDRKAAGQAAYDAGVAETNRLANPADPNEQIARENGYPDFDAMLQDGYESMRASGQFDGSFDEYKQMWLDQQARSQGATAAAEPG